MNVEYNVFQTKKDKTTRMMISPAHFDEVVKHSPLRFLKSYDLCKQVMCRRARCQDRSFQLEDLIRGKREPLLFLCHPVGPMENRDIPLLNATLFSVQKCMGYLEKKFGTDRICTTLY